MVANQLKQGLGAGEGLNELATRIKEVLGNNLTRARSIARTQTGGAVSSGRHVGMKEAGIERKGWLSSKDANVRETHKDADKRYAKGIPLDEPFVVGGCFLMHPGDPGGSIGEIAHCRCVELAVKIGNKVFNLEYYETQKFYSYEDMQKSAA
jgi:SPP1 gp7 family putative phage head morphogenesis protein